VCVCVFCLFVCLFVSSLLVHNAEVRNATRYLMQIVIPNFVVGLLSQRIVPLTSEQLVAEIHAAGINLRCVCAVLFYLCMCMCMMSVYV
jgi:hypothetical protein